MSAYWASVLQSAQLKKYLQRVFWAVLLLWLIMILGVFIAVFERVWSVRSAIASVTHMLQSNPYTVVQRDNKVSDVIIYNESGEAYSITSGAVGTAVYLSDNKALFVDEGSLYMADARAPVQQLLFALELASADIGDVEIVDRGIFGSPDGKAIELRFRGKEEIDALFAMYGAGKAASLDALQKQFPGCMDGEGLSFLVRYNKEGVIFAYRYLTDGGTEYMDWGFMGYYVLDEWRLAEGWYTLDGANLDVNMDYISDLYVELQDELLSGLRAKYPDSFSASSGSDEAGGVLSIIPSVASDTDTGSSVTDEAHAESDGLVHYHDTQSGDIYYLDENGVHYYKDENDIFYYIDNNGHRINKELSLRTIENANGESQAAINIDGVDLVIDGINAADTVIKDVTGLENDEILDSLTGN